MPRADGSKWLLRASVALPLAMLAANLLAWLRWGTDLPYFDDWLAYDQGTSLSLSPRHLFQAINNTISPVGLTLDVLAQRGLGGNPLPYQTLSMLGVLGGLLALQWRLLGWAMRDTRAQAVLFGFCFLMLQSGSYWGEQNLAYHQALPLLALLGAACLALPAGAGGAWRVTAVFGLGLLAGLSYISGAIAALVMGVSWVLLGWVLRRQPARALAWRVRCHGAALLLAGTLTSALQIVLTRGVEQKRDHQYMGLTWPDRVDFWAYLAGKIGRSTGHAFASMALEVLWVVLLTVAVVAATALALRGLGMFGGVGRARLRRWALVFIPLSGVVLSYLLIVSLGRAGLRDPSIQGAGPVFEFAYLRFHFFLGHATAALAGGGGCGLAAVGTARCRGAAGPGLRAGAGARRVRCPGFLSLGVGISGRRDSLPRSAAGGGRADSLQGVQPDGPARPDACFRSCP